MGSEFAEALTSAVNQLSDLKPLAMLLIAAAAFALYAAWTVAHRVGAYFEHWKFKPKQYTVKESKNNYVLFSQSDWKEDFEHKKTDVLIRYKGQDGRVRSSREKAYRTTDKKFLTGTIGLPKRVREDLEIEFDGASEQSSLDCDLEISRTQRFPGEQYWNHPEDSIRISTQTTFWVTLLTTIFGLLTAFLFEHVFYRV